MIAGLAAGSGLLLKPNAEAALKQVYQDRSGRPQFLEPSVFPAAPFSGVSD